VAPFVAEARRLLDAAIAAKGAAALGRIEEQAEIECAEN
jgi:hypothetical protein